MHHITPQQQSKIHPSSMFFEHFSRIHFIHCRSKLTHLLASWVFTPQQQNSVTIQSVNKLPKFDEFQDPNYALKITFWSLHPSSKNFRITPQQHLTKNTPQ
jgi:hypothetical protein